jgi:hypothetical protein
VSPPRVKARSPTDRSFQINAIAGGARKLAPEFLIRILGDCENFGYTRGPANGQRHRHSELLAATRSAATRVARTDATPRAAVTSRMHIKTIHCFPRAAVLTFRARFQGLDA